MTPSVLRSHSRLRAAFLCLLGIAAIGAVTLFAPPPRFARAQYVDQSTWGGTSGGGANAQSITIANYDVDAPGVVLRFIPGFTNTGPATISVNGRSPVALQRPSSIGLVALSGQELLVSEPTAIMFTGAVYKVVENTDMTRIGQSVEFRGSAAPRGTLIEDGSCVSQTTYAPLFSVVGTSYGSCSAGLFKLPDSRGQTFAAFDAQGANGAANRITTATCSAPNTAGGTCGLEGKTVQSSNIQQFSISVSSGGSSVPTSATPWNNASSINNSGVSGDYPQSASAVGNTTSFSGNVGSASPTILATLPPITLGLRAIKF